MTESTLTHQNRIFWLDYGKALSMLMVILYHTQIYYANSWQSSDIYTPIMISPFFFISGYVLYNKNNFDVKKSICGVFRGLVWPYFVFTLLIWLPKALVRGNEISFTDDLLNIILGYASWFVAALTVAKFMFIFIRRISGKLISLWGMTSIVFLLGLILSFYVNNVTPWYFISACIALVYMLLGYTFRVFEKQLSFLRSKNMIALSIACYISINLIFTFYLQRYVNIFPEKAPLGLDSIPYFVLSLVGIWMMINITYFLPKQISFLSYIGKNSLVFYFLNSGLILIITKLCQKYNFFVYNGHFAQTIAIFGITTLLLYLASLFINKYAGWALGDKESVNRITNYLIKKSK